MADQTKERATCKAQIAHGGIHGHVEFSFGGGKPVMPNLGALKSSVLTIVGVVVLLILLLASTTSIPRATSAS